MPVGEDKVIDALKAFPNGLSLNALMVYCDLKQREVRIVLVSLEKRKLLGAYMRDGVFYYSYYDWVKKQNDSNTNIVSSEVAQ